uniref:Metalloendopeptidase n=1 Tax=Leptobrachium leishanense TaxID=445787 RepID=A0A8C5QDK1_9ANUR
MKLYLLIILTLLGVSDANPRQILPRNPRNSEGHSDSAKDVFSGILASNQDTSRVMIQGDIAVRRNRNALSCPGKSCLWVKSADGLVPVPYRLSDNYTSDEKEVIKGAMDELMVLTCIRFVVHTIEPNYLRIHPADGCWSYIGRVGGAQDISIMKTGCLHRGIVQHELLHSLGFQHEQCRSDRDKYIRINWGNINQDKERNFYKLSTQNLGIPYDYQSVLHYGKYAFANDAGKPTLEPTGNPGAAIGQRVGLSSLDVVKINTLYQCSLCAYLLPDPRGGFSLQPGQQHPNISKCTWLIRVPEGKVFLQIESNSTKSSQTCAFGNIKVYDGASRESPLIPGKTCGATQPLWVMSTENLMRVEFEKRNEKINFKAAYASASCGGFLSSPAGNFSTPGFPSKYPIAVDCFWIISATPGNKIMVSIAPFNLESSPRCSYDYLLIRDGRKQRKKCGLIPTLRVASSGPSLLLHFHSDASVQADGFHATYVFAAIAP